MTKESPHRKMTPGEYVAELYRKFVDREAMLYILTTPARRSTKPDKLAKYPDEKIACGITVHVRITNVRSLFGQKQVLVTPLDGSGSAWVKVDHRLKLLPRNPDEDASASEPDGPRSTG